MNEQNEFEIEKLTEKQIKETHLFQSSANAGKEEQKEEKESQPKSKEISEVKLTLEIEDSQIGESNKRVKKSTYGSNLKKKVDQYNNVPENFETKIDFE